MTDTAELRKLNLWQKIAHVQATLGPIAKNKSTTTGPKYDYVTAERVFSTLQARLGTIGIVIEPDLTPDRPVGYAIPDEDLLRECLAIAEYLRIGR
jgi:hypothetical protein